MLRPVGPDAFHVRGLDLPDLSEGAGDLRGARRTPAGGFCVTCWRRRRRTGTGAFSTTIVTGAIPALPSGAFPGLARLRYSPELRGDDFGLALRFRFPAVVLGNSSTAITGGPNARSLTRLAMTEPGLAPPRLCPRREQSPLRLSRTPRPRRGRPLPLELALHGHHPGVFGLGSAVPRRIRDDARSLLAGDHAGNGR